MEYVLLYVKDIPPTVRKELKEIEGVRYINLVRRCVGVEEPDVSTDTRPLEEVIRLFQRNNILLMRKSTYPTLDALITVAEKKESPLRQFARLMAEARVA